MRCTPFFRPVLIATFLLAPAVSARAGVEADASWAKAMVTARTAAIETPGARTFEPFVTDIIRGGEAAGRVSVSVSGLQRLWLVADVGDDGYNWDQAIWAEPRLVRADGTELALGALDPVSVSVGWGSLLKDRDHAEGALRIGDRAFADGFWAHAPSELCFELDGAYERFEAWVGISVVAGANGSARFHVLDEPSPTAAAWKLLEARFPEETAAFREDAPDGNPDAWFGDGDAAAYARALAVRGLERAGDAAAALQAEFDARSADAPAEAWLDLYARALAARRASERVAALLERLNPEALRRAVHDLAESFPGQYTGAPEFLRRLDAFEARLAALQADPERAVDLESRKAIVDEMDALRRDALLANPLIDFDRLLVVRRSAGSPALGLPANWQGNCCLAKTGYDNEIAVFDLGSGALDTLYRPEHGEFVGDVELHYDAGRMMFSMPREGGAWRIWEVDADGTGLRRATPGDEPDVDHYDACYLPDGRVIFSSSAPMRAVPCVDGSSNVANLYLFDPETGAARQLCFDQEHNWCPDVLNNGRVLYLRWEYTDTPHSQTRLLFHMNPDGTGQMEYYGSNSYWPNGVFYARPVPNHPTMVAGIVTGHHGVRRMGELVLFDPARGRREADGVVQRIPGHGLPVEPIIRDNLVDDSWPRFLHPFPLSDKYLIVSAQPTPQSLWGVYLVDVFDNMLLLAESPGNVLFEPVPLRPRPRPPVIADKVNLARDDGLVYLMDVYAGGGLEGVPRGAVSSLRVFAYNYSFRGMGGLLGVLGMDGPWDIKRVLGTVPVEEDGSALFRVPANTPVAVQPLDHEGKALQHMRSWFTLMPGEVLSCVGCHEQQNSGPPVRPTLAARRPPRAIAPWRGPVRGFSFAREVQPVLDRYCVGCHDGADADLPDLRGTERITDWRSVTPGQGGRLGGQFSVAYAALHRYVRRPGIESDYHMLTPLDFHADTTELVQMLRKGHYNAPLDPESWDRLVTWIDLNAPYHGYWHEVAGENALTLAERQSELARIYGGNDENPEIIPEALPYDTAPVPPPPPAAALPAPPELAGWPFDADEARRRQAATGPTTRAVDLGDGITLELALIPAGEFLMGATDGHPDEGPVTRVAIPQAFWMGRFEVTNEQYAQFDPDHDSRVESKHAYQFGVHGFPLNGPRQPVVRVSWEQAMAFCAWLSARTGEDFVLPSEAEWEYACRAGAATAFHFGDLDADYSPYANLADRKLREFADDPYHVFRPLTDATPYDDWIPRDDRFDDGGLVSVDVGGYRPNAWGLHDMHGNVWEWTHSAFRDYPWSGHGRDFSGDDDGVRVVRGGSWYDRPVRARAAYRLAYRPYQRVFNVGFRVVAPVPEGLAGERQGE